MTPVCRAVPHSMDARSRNVASARATTSASIQPRRSWPRRTGASEPDERDPGRPTQLPRRSRGTYLVPPRASARRKVTRVRARCVGSVEPLNRGAPAASTATAATTPDAVAADAPAASWAAGALGAPGSTRPGGVVADLSDGDHVDGVVELAVAARVEPLPVVRQSRLRSGQFRGSGRSGQRPGTGGCRRCGRGGSSKDGTCEHRLSAPLTSRIEGACYSWQVGRQR